VIGLELGSVYAARGPKLTVIEYLDAINPAWEAEVQKKNFMRILKKQLVSTFVIGRPRCRAQKRAKTKPKVTYKLTQDDSRTTRLRTRRFWCRQAEARSTTAGPLNWAVGALQTAARDRGCNTRGKPLSTGIYAHRRCDRRPDAGPTKPEDEGYRPPRGR